MDTMTSTKLIGGLCGTFLVFLLLKWGGEIIFHPGGHGETEAAYTLEVAESGDAGVEDTGPTFEELMAMADIGKGERVFRKCTACHKAEEGENATGPSLFQILGRDKAVVDGFTYSAAMVGFGGTWTPEELDEFLTKPGDYVSGTTMGFAGLPKDEDRANLIAYLETL